MSAAQDIDNGGRVRTLGDYGSVTATPHRFVGICGGNFAAASILAQFHFWDTSFQKRGIAGEMEHTNAAIAHELYCSEDQVKRAKRVLVSLGFLTVRRTRDGSAHTVNYDAIDAALDAQPARIKQWPKPVGTGDGAQPYGRMRPAVQANSPVPSFYRKKEEREGEQAHAQEPQGQAEEPRPEVDSRPGAATTPSQPDRSPEMKTDVAFTANTRDYPEPLRALLEKWVRRVSKAREEKGRRGTRRYKGPFGQQTVDAVWREVKGQIEDWKAANPRALEVGLEQRLGETKGWEWHNQLGWLDTHYDKACRNGHSTEAIEADNAYQRKVKGTAKKKSRYASTDEDPRQRLEPTKVNRMLAERCPHLYVLLEDEESAA